MGERQDALTQIRECVKLDNDDKACFDFYKMLKKFNKVMDKIDDNLAHNRHAEALQNSEKAQKMNVAEPVYKRRLAVLDCQCNAELKRTDKALEVGERGAEGRRGGVKRQQRHRGERG